MGARVGVRAGACAACYENMCDVGAGENPRTLKNWVGIILNVHNCPLEGRRGSKFGKIWSTQLLNENDP